LIDCDDVAERLRSHGLAAWADLACAQLREVRDGAPHGDWPLWKAALGDLPMPTAGQVTLDDGALWLRPQQPLDAGQVATLADALGRLHPWRKGPYRFGDLRLDTEWRSDWKWSRLSPQIDDLTDRRVLDVGCGNGYHLWRAVLSGARLVLGIDPTAVFLAQYLAVRRWVAALDADLAARIHLQPVGIEAVPRDLRAFDTVFSMGVLYHRRSPIDHLVQLRGLLRRGGQLVLETLVIDGSGSEVLVPTGRYAKMRNVWFIPTVALLETWLARVGFRKARCVDVTTTTTAEQRRTDWMTFESLADFLDPADSGLTVEGYPAPRRAILIAEAD
jgi:tRNA (mo5U34)-methyltransferase